MFNLLRTFDFLIFSGGDQKGTLLRNALRCKLFRVALQYLENVTKTFQGLS